jgi:RNA polymerase sigma factor (sigma-70 family)
MVLGTCRRVLGNAADAEDAFQATFLVLVRKAAGLRARETVGNWLYGVAYRTALEAKRATAKRRAKEVKAMPREEASDVAWDDVRDVLDQELAGLPERYREVLVLSDLEGKGRKEVARLVGCPEGTVASRLARARSLLAGRLARRGLALSPGPLAVLLSGGAGPAAVPPLLLGSTVRAATLLAGGKTVASVTSTEVAILMERVMKTMLLTRLKIATLLLLVVGLAAGTAGSIYHVYADERTAVARQPDRPREEPKRGAAPAAGQGPKLRMTLEGHTAEVVGVALSPDGKVLASGSADKTIKLWDVKTGQNTATLMGHTDQLCCVALSPDGKTLASGSADETVRLWDVRTGKNTAILTGHDDTVRSVVFSPDGKTLASGGDDYSIKLWDVKTGKNTVTLEPHTDDGPGVLWIITSVCFSPDGKTLVSASYDGIRFWDVKTGKVKAHLVSGKPDAVHAVTFSADGKTLASAHFAAVVFNRDGTPRTAEPGRTIRLWDVASGKNTAVFRGHTGLIAAVVFSRDGKTLASAGYDNTIRLWDVRTGKNTATLEGHTGDVFGIAVSRDGRMLASASEDKSIRLWDVHVGGKKGPSR